MRVRVCVNLIKMALVPQLLKVNLTISLIRL